MPGRRSGNGELTASEALALAVELANEECRARFAEAPFTSDTYEVFFEGRRWHWGALDLAGEGGYSAIVSFDARGGDRRVEVFLSTDMITP